MQLLFNVELLLFLFWFVKYFDIKSNFVLSANSFLVLFKNSLFCFFFLIKFDFIFWKWKTYIPGEFSFLNEELLISSFVPLDNKFVALLLFE